jgi:hypothetical protein
MPNPNPYRARHEKARKRIALLTDGDIQSARKVLWSVIIDGSERLESLGQHEHGEFYKLANAVTGAVREFRSLIEASEMEERVAELERRQQTTWAAA